LLYRLLFRLALTRIDAERAHALAVRSLRRALAVPGARPLVARWSRPAPALAVDALGTRFASPLGVAAGLDKDGEWFDELGALGFGFVEVGTVTAIPQAGNPPPRVWRLVDDRALLNAMGFPNAGAAVVARRLRRRSGRTVVAANVGKSKRAPLDAAGPDYRASVRAVAPEAAFVVLNVSSPNTPGLREMQGRERLAALVADVRGELDAIGVARPLLVKIAPDLSDEQVDELADLALELRLDGLIATNTTLSREGLRTDPALWRDRPGGVSGAPLRPRSLELLRRLHARVGGRLVLISVGGVESADDVWQRIRAGATLVQAQTGFIYGGPGWPRAINRGLAELARRDGFASVQDAIGR